MKRDLGVLFNVKPHPVSRLEPERFVKRMSPGEEADADEADGAGDLVFGLGLAGVEGDDAVKGVLESAGSAAGVAGPADGGGQGVEFLGRGEAMDDLDEVGRGVSGGGGVAAEAEVVAGGVADDVFAEAPGFVFDVGDDRRTGGAVPGVKLVDGV